MRKGILYSWIIMIAMGVGLSSCGDPVTRSAASRGKFKVRSWLRYEFRSAKTFSYGNSQVRDNQHVIGYEPSWLIYDSLYQSYPYQLLSDLVVGEYDVNPKTGFARNDSARDAFRNKDIVEMAAAVNTDINVLLAVTDYGDYGYRTDFLSEGSKKNLLNTLDFLMDELGSKRGSAERERVGIMMDFPSVPWNLRHEYAEFLARLNKDLDNREQGKRCLIYVVLPAYDNYQIYRDTSFTKKVIANTDLFILRAHTFVDKHEDEGIHGPMMPIAMPGTHDLDSSVTYYVESGLIPKKQMVIEFPYYGTCWSTKKTKSWIRPLMPLNEILNTKDGARKLDTLSQCWWRNSSADGDTLSYYYEDTLSLNTKYDWVRQNKLGGISIYGLGYGHGMDDAAMQEGLWETVAVHFAEPAPHLLFPAIGFLLCFLAVGIVASVVAHWEVRYSLRERMRSFWYYFALLMLIILAIILNSIPSVPVIFKLLSVVAILVFPLGRKAMKFARMAAR